MSTPIFTTAYNGQAAVLDADQSNALLAVYNVDTNLYTSASDFDWSGNADLLQETLTSQQSVPFLDPNDITPTSLSFSDTTIATNFLSSQQTSSDNTDTSVGSATTIVPNASLVPPISFSESTQSREFGNLIYPLDARYSQNEQDHLFIEQFEYRPPTSALFSQSFSETFQGVQRVSPIEVLRGTVKLPIPGGISDTNTVNWNQSAIGPKDAALVAASMGVANAVGNAVNSAMDAGGLIGGLAAGSSSLLESVKGGAGELATVLKDPVAGDILRRELISSAVGTLGGSISAEEILTRSSGRVTNKNLELLFSGQTLRTFSFAFKLVPRNSTESAEIRKIIRFFKQGSAPKKSITGEGGSSLFLKTPNVFRLSYRRGSEYIKGLNKFKICACQSVGVTYSEGAYASYAADSQPISVTLALGFTELTPLFYDDYEEPPEHLSLPALDNPDEIGF